MNSHKLKQNQKDLGKIYINRVHQKYLNDIKSIISTLSKFGDNEPSNNYNKYVGTPDNEFSNDILRKNLETMNI